MNKPARHNPSRVKAYVLLLRKHHAPEALIADFLEVISIDDQISEAGRGIVDPIENHFFHSCLQHNFPSPYDKGEKRAHFRPAINHADPAADGDTGWGAGLAGRLNEEQAYRRGFDQGFADAQRLIDDGNLAQIEQRAKEINRWRFSKILFDTTMPGQFEEWQISLRPVRSIAPKLRYEILERDNFRCVLCGDDSEAGAQLEVDHIVPVSKGGTDDRSNLRALCWACNAGKGDKAPPSN